MNPLNTTVGVEPELAKTLKGSEQRESESMSAEASPAADPLVGSVLGGRYRILKRVGAGGMGAVYLATHTKIKKPVAIKILLGQATQGSKNFSRFTQEAQSVSRIRHPNIVDITDFGDSEDEMPFFAMEYLDGEDLHDLLRREGALPWPRARRIIIQILNALEAAHHAGIVHRDLKPGNCFIVKNGSQSDYIKLLDFGIAKIVSDEVDTHSLTQTGTIIGTPHYMSPEQAKCEEIDHRADLYSAGVMLFQMLTGEVPFHATNAMGILTRHITQPPPRPSQVNPDANFPRELNHIILRALEKTPSKRYSSAAEFREAIESLGSPASYARGVVRQARSPRVILVALPVLFATGALALFLSSGVPSLFLKPPPETEKTIDTAIVDTAPSIEITNSESTAPEEGDLEDQKKPAPLTESADSENSQPPSGEDPKTSTTRSPTSEPQPAPPTKARRKTPYKSQIKRSLSSFSKKRVIRECYKKFAFSSDRVPTEIEISSKTGRTVAVKITSALYADNPLGKCISGALNKHKFPTSPDEKNFTGRFTFSPPS